MAFAAELRTESLETPGSEARAMQRHSLNLGASAGADASPVLIHNISSSGMLIESTVKLAGHDSIEVTIPEAGTVKASVMWASDNLYGCQFERPLSRGALSAALLRSPADTLDSGPRPEASPWPVTAHAIEDAIDDRAAPEADARSRRTRAAIIAGLAVLAWVPLLLAIRLIS